MTITVSKTDYRSSYAGSFLINDQRFFYDTRWSARHDSWTVRVHPIDSQHDYLLHYHHRPEPREVLKTIKTKIARLIGME